MPWFELRRLGGVLDRLLRPAQAARNAEWAASDASRTVRERAAIDREVDAVAKRPADRPSMPT